jgi:hypothetical protein
LCRIARYRVDEVRYVDELTTRLSEFSGSSLLLLSGTNSDSNKQTRAAAFDGISNFKTDDKVWIFYLSLSLTLSPSVLLSFYFVLTVTL